MRVERESELADFYLHDCQTVTGCCDPVPVKPSRKNERDPDVVVDLQRRVALLEADVTGLRRQVHQFDYDLQDAVDGFYKRRQSDRMREVRAIEEPKRKLTWAQIEKQALTKAVGLTSDSDRYPAQETVSETSTEKTE